MSTSIQFALAGPILPSVGGIIFYIESTADGTYSFWDANGDPVAAPPVGTDCTGWTYSVSGASKDKFYVVYDDLYSNNNWCPYIDDAVVTEATGFTETAIGFGKTNTIGIMNIDDGKYLQEDANGKPTIWFIIAQMNEVNAGGCDDWFVGSKDELEQLRLSGVVDWFASNNFCSSSEVNSNYVQSWVSMIRRWQSNYKKTVYSVCGIRSF